MERETERSTRTDTSRRRRDSSQTRAGHPEQSSRDPEQSTGDPERIRILAYEIYESRCTSGMLGDSISDWLEAERRLDQPGKTGTGKAEPEETGPGNTKPARAATPRKPSRR